MINTQPCTYSIQVYMCMIAMGHLIRAFLPVYSFVMSPKISSVDQCRYVDPWPCVWVEGGWFRELYLAFKSCSQVTWSWTLSLTTPHGHALPSHMTKSHDKSRDHTHPCHMTKSHDLALPSHVVFHAQVTCMYMFSSIHCNYSTEQPTPGAQPLSKTTLPIHIVCG